jgi:hypothetical protein
MALFLAAIVPLLALAQETIERTTFRIKYIAQGVVYLDGGRAAGLKEGQKLIVEREVAPPAADSTSPTPPPPSGIIAALQVISVAASSAVCEVTSSSEPVQVGDLVRFAPEVVKEQREEQRAHLRNSDARSYPQVITFTGADPVIEEARASVPQPPSPEINRTRGRIGVEYSSILSHNNPSTTNSDIGLVARMDMTRIGGTYWNFSGYWRGRFTSLSGGLQPVTVTDMVNRTYHLSLTYSNPRSPLVAGVGRLYLPWAPSLDTIDGGYVGRKAGGHATLGIFAGTTPDPTSYDYNPNQRLVGAFINLEGGSFDHTRVTTTFGVALSAIDWHSNRQFAFFETGIFFKNNLAIYDSMQIDAPHVAVTNTSPSGTPTPPTKSSTGGLNRSYLTLRYQPHPRLELDVSHTYFRDFPTFNPLLIGTGLLDRYLFQGFSGGARVGVTKRISVYSSLGRSSRSGDTNGSWNQLYGVTFAELWHTGLRADLRYSRFNSSFGQGEYKAISLSRSFRESLQWVLQGGFQNLSSTLTKTSQTHFLNTYLDWSPGRVVFFQAGYTWQRGGTMNYDQFQFIVGKRF